MNFDNFNNNNEFENIKKNNEIVINILRENLKNEKNINIISKGPTAKYCNNGHAINQALILTNKKYVYMNDFHSLLGVEEYIKDIKFFFVPFYPHIFGYPFKNFTYLDFYKYLKKFNFNGYLFIYQINNEFNIPCLNKYKINTITTTDVPAFIISKILNLKDIVFCTYGYSLNSNGIPQMKGYHPIFREIYDNFNYDKICKYINNILKNNKVEEYRKKLENFFIKNGNFKYKKIKNKNFIKSKFHNGIYFYKY